jgi:hypothetical protein
MIFEIRPNILDRTEIRRVHWPSHYIDLGLADEIFYDIGCMYLAAVMLKNKFLGIHLIVIPGLNDVILKNINIQL